MWIKCIWEKNLMLCFSPWKVTLWHCLIYDRVPFYTSGNNCSSGLFQLKESSCWSFCYPSCFEILGGLGKELCLAMSLVSNITACYIATIIFACQVLLIMDVFWIQWLLHAHIATDETFLICGGKVFTFGKTMAAIAVFLSLEAGSLPYCLREYSGFGQEEQWEQNDWYTHAYRCTHTHTHTQRSYSIHCILYIYLYVVLPISNIRVCVLVYLCTYLHTLMTKLYEASWA